MLSYDGDCIFLELIYVSSIPWQNTFNFERRDWMTVKTKELPPGNKLVLKMSGFAFICVGIFARFVQGTLIFVFLLYQIMGLNPPFGVNAGLANKFIDKALEFKPKLLILIVPLETQK